MSCENQEVRMRTRILDEEYPLSPGDRAMCEWALGEILGLRQHLHIVSEQRDVAQRTARRCKQALPEPREPNDSAEIAT